MTDLASQQRRTAADIPASLHVLASDARRGAEIFGQSLADRLMARGARADVLALSRTANERSLDVPSLGPRFAPRTALPLRRRMRDFDVAVGHGSTSLPALAMASVGSSVPFVYRSIGDPRGWSTTHRRRMQTTLFLRRAAAVAVLWPVVADVIHQFHGIPHERIHVIPNAVDAEGLHPVTPDERRRARESLDLDPDVPVAVMLGALSHEKDVSLAIESVARLDDVVLVLAGNGPDRGPLEAQAARQLPGRVRFLGSVDDPETVLASADLVLLTSNTEGLPGVLIEAGLRALPTVATDVGGVREIVRSGHTGLVVDDRRPGTIADAIRSALDDDGSLGEAARARCLTRFDLDTVADQWAELLRTVAGGP